MGGAEEETDQLSYYFAGSVMYFSGIYTVLNFGYIHEFEVDLSSVIFI